MDDSGEPITGEQIETIKAILSAPIETDDDYLILADLADENE